MMSSSMAQATERVPRKVRHGGPGRRLERSAVAGEGGMRGIEDRSWADAPQREHDGGRGRDETHTDRTRREKAGAQQPRMGGGGQMSASEVARGPVEPSVMTSLMNLRYSVLSPLSKGGFSMICPVVSHRSACGPINPRDR